MARLCGRARGQGHEKLARADGRAPGFMIVAYYKHNHLSARSSLAPPASHVSPASLLGGKAAVTRWPGAALIQ